MGETFPLRAEALTRRFGRFTALRSVSVSLRQNEIHGLIGPNGAGKTTLLRLLSGQDQPERGGAIWLHDQRVTHKPDWKRARLGLGRSFQRAQLFADMTVADNLVLAIRGCDFARGFDLSSGGDSVRWAAERAAREVFLGGRCNDLVRNLSHGERRLVELAMAFAEAPPTGAIGTIGTIGATEATEAHTEPTGATGATEATRAHTEPTGAIEATEAHTEPTGAIEAHTEPTETTGGATGATGTTEATRAHTEPTGATEAHTEPTQATEAHTEPTETTGGATGATGTTEAIEAHTEPTQATGTGTAGATRVVLLDEPLAGLGAGETTQATDYIRRKKAGRAILMIEHDLDAVFELADRITVLIAGEAVVEGTRDEILRDSRVRVAYLPHDKHENDKHDKDTHDKQAVPLAGGRAE